jgi:hypothetical protein
MGAHVPVATPVFEATQARQAPAHDSLQHTPSTHGALSAQFALLVQATPPPALHAPPASQVHGVDVHAPDECASSQTPASSAETITEQTPWGEHRRHAPPQRSSQHTPFAQIDDKHSLSLVHADPLAYRSQAPEVLQVIAP